VVFGIIDGSNRRGRSRRRWIDDAEECGNNDLPAFSVKAADRTDGVR